MEDLISKLKFFTDFNIKIKLWCQQNNIQQPKILDQSVDKISKLYDNFLEKQQFKEKQQISFKKSNEPIWFQNQLILFHWTVLAFSFLNNISLKSFKETQFQFLSSIFRHKELYVIQYELNCMLIKGKQIRNSWKTEQQEILSNIIKQISQKNKWNEIARQLYKISEGKYFRQGKHCRERWHSYIQSKEQHVWNLQDDIELLQLVSAKGKKWNQIINKFTISLNKISLKKRYKNLLEEGKAKFMRPFSQGQLIGLVLKEKYEKLQNDPERKQEKRSFKQKVKKVIQNKEIKSGNSCLELNKDFEQNESQLVSGFDQNRIVDYYEQTSKKYEHIGKLKQEEQIQYCTNQQFQELNYMTFENSARIFVNNLNINYVPIQFFPQNNQIFPEYQCQSFNFHENNSFFTPELNYFFY